MPHENWKPVVDCEGLYAISDSGKVRREVSKTRAKAGTMLKGYIDRDGYANVGVSVHGKPKLIRVHRAVFTAFVGPIPQGFVINHKDGNKLHNAVSNLEAVSNRDNILHAYAVLNRSPTGNKIHESDVISIREKHADGIAMKNLAKKYGLSHTAIMLIVRGKTWKRVGGPIRTERKLSQTQADVTKRISDDTARNIVQRCKNGESPYKLAKEFGVHARSIYNWIEGKSRKLT